MQRIPKRYHDAYRGVYGETAPCVPPKRKTQPKPNLSPTEDQEQTVLVNWLDRRHIPFYHVPNGGQRNALEGAKFKRLGVRAGVPDICVCRANKTHHGLYIELKRLQGGRLTENQSYWQRLLEREGYKWVLALGAADAIKAVEEYLRG